MNIETRLNYRNIHDVQLTIRLDAGIEEEQEGGTGRRPGAYCAVVDRSSSMEGELLDQARAILLEAVLHLDARDLLSVVTFADDARVVVPLQQPVDRRDIMREIAAIQARGASNLAGGWSLGRDELAGAPEGMARRLLVFTDGCPTAELTEPADARRIIGDGRDRLGIRTSVLLFGDVHNCCVPYIFTDGGGAIHDASSPEDLRAILETELGRLRPVRVRNVRVRLRELPLCERLFTTFIVYPESKLPDGRLELAVGDLIAGETQSLFMTMELPESPLLSDGNPAVTYEGEAVLELEMLWDELGRDQIRSCRQTQTIRILAVQNPADTQRHEVATVQLARDRRDAGEG